MRNKDAEFFVLVRATRDEHGAMDGTRFVSARRTRPEEGLLRSMDKDEVWVKLSLYVPLSVIFGELRRRDPAACWVEPVVSECAAAEAA